MQAKWEQKLPSALRIYVVFAFSIWLLIQLNHRYFPTKQSLQRCGLRIALKPYLATKRKRGSERHFLFKFFRLFSQNRLLYDNGRIMSQLKHYNIIGITFWTVETLLALRGQITNWFACRVNLLREQRGLLVTSIFGKLTKFSSN